MEQQLIFVLSPPRSGSTLLQRMLGSHPEVLTHPEPHIITPLAYLGYHDRVDAAPYDHINSGEAIRAFVHNLPNGEEDYLDALRAYTDTLYGRMLATAKRQQTRFMDKTPAYGLVWPFLTRLYPKAKYVVLTRHPLGIFSSFANSFFHGSWERAHAHNAVLERYVPSLAELVRKPPYGVRVCHVRYEELVREPQTNMRRVFEYMDLPHEPSVVNYGENFASSTKGAGDPIGVDQHGQPTEDSTHKWVGELLDDPGKRKLAEQMIGRLSEDDLKVWGFDRDKLWSPLRTAQRRGSKTFPLPSTPTNRFTLQRRIFLALRKDIEHRPHGHMIRKLRYYCDVLLRP